MHGVRDSRPYLEHACEVYCAYLASESRDTMKVKSEDTSRSLDAIALSLSEKAGTATRSSESDHDALLVIEAETSGPHLQLRELWRYRELLYFLIWRDIKIRYKQTVLGAAWAIIQPLFAMLLFTLFFGKLARVPSDGIPYPLFAYAGLLPWTFFSNALTNSGNSLVGSTSLITKVYFPRVFIPGASVAAGLLE